MFNHFRQGSTVEYRLYRVYVCMRAYMGECKHVVIEKRK